jgi:GT2 family glycosyltransferase
MTLQCEPIWHDANLCEESNIGGDLRLAGSDSNCMEIPALDVVINIATSGRPDLLARTLKSLSACELPAGYRETVVVENGPRCGAEEVVRNAPPILNARYMYTSRANKSAAMNGVLKTLGDCLIIYLDDDVRLAPRTILAYTETAQREGPENFYGGPLNIDYDSPPPQWLKEYMPKSATGWELSGREQRVSSAVFLGGNWAAFSQTLRSAGGFSLDRGPGSRVGCTGEETEMQRLLLSKGLSGIYVPAARVWHYVPSDRCTPEWTLQRNFLNGMQEGARAAGHGRPLGIPPWWIVSRYFKGIVRSTTWSLSRDPKLRFRAKNRRSYDRGLICGVWRQSQSGLPRMRLAS